MNITEVDMVAHPKHYEGSTSLECIDTMKLVFGDVAVCYFCLCNAFKYLWRYKHKNGEEDIKKARWYVDYVSSMPTEEYSEGLEIEKLHCRVENLLCAIEHQENVR